MTPIMIISVIVALLALIPLAAFVLGGAKVNGEIDCPAGEWTPIVRNFGTAMPRSICVTLDDDVSGRWRELRRRRLFRGASVAGELSPELLFQRRWIDWRYRIEIRPEADVTAIVS